MADKSRGEPTASRPNKLINNSVSWTTNAVFCWTKYVSSNNRVQRENSVEKWTRICPYANIDLENLRGSKEEATNSFLSLKKIPLHKPEF